jgi:hypothetical protein
MKVQIAILLKIHGFQYSINGKNCMNFRFAIILLSALKCVLYLINIRCVIYIMEYLKQN